MRGTLEVLRIVRPQLAPRLPGVTALIREVRGVLRLVHTHHRRGAWQPLRVLSRIDRERVDAAIGRLCERLASVASIL